MDVLELWYARVDDRDFLAMLPESRKAVLKKRVAKATSRSSSELVFPKLAEQAGEQPRIHDNRPLVFHPNESVAAMHMDLLNAALSRYRKRSPRIDAALLGPLSSRRRGGQGGGIGSVGTLCLVALLMSMADRPLFLQVKEAGPSVLEPFAGRSLYPHHGQRVVMGQRLMQPASDLFLGWVTGDKGRQFYIRQLRD